MFRTILSAALTVAIACCAATAAPPADAVDQGEELKAAAIAKWEADIEAAMQRKAEAGKADNRPLVKQLFVEIKSLKAQLLRVKAKTPEQFVAEEEEKARIAKAAKAEADVERAWAYGREKRGEKALGLPMPADVNPVAVVYAAQRAVKQKLKNPDGAKFPGGLLDMTDVRSHCKYNGDNQYTVTSWVDATNGFGGRVRTVYVAVLEKNGDGWIAKDLVLIE
jgi:hypothetical protein